MNDNGEQKPRRVADIMSGPGTPLARMLGTAKTLDRADRILAELFGQGANSLLRCASLSCGTATLVTSNASFAAEVKRNQRRICQALASRLNVSVERLDIRIGFLPTEVSSTQKKQSLPTAALVALKPWLKRPD